MTKSENQPHVKRRDWLKYGNPPADFAKTPRCGAKTRNGSPCRGPAMRNGRCRLHGGKSTGPKTPEGLALARIANWKHGRYSASAKSERLRFLYLLRQCRRILSRISHEAIQDAIRASK
jgi:hypothetical protein